MYYYKQIKKQHSKGTLDRYIGSRNFNACISNSKKIILIKSTVIIYGGAANNKVAKNIAKNISVFWNKPKATAQINGVNYRIIFKIKGIYHPHLNAKIVSDNRDQKNYFIRVEPEISLGVSLMDGVCSNTGFFKISNVAYKGASTEAHEYGHALGLIPNTATGHPEDLDLRGQGSPGIMHPRGTWVDPKYQYDPKGTPGGPGGTVHPDKRKVKQAEVDLLKLGSRSYKNKGWCRLGRLTNKWHDVTYSA